MRTILLVCILLLCVAAVNGQEISPALNEQMTTIEEVTSQLRGLDVLSPVERRFPTRQDLQTYLLDSINSQLDEETLRQETQFYIAFGFLPPDVDLLQTYLKLYNAQVAGFYDPESKQMNVILVSGEQPGNRLGLLEQVIYSHEFVHVLQDQHFGLREIGFDPNADIDIDQLLAIQALIEGDATFVMNQYTVLAAQANPTGALIELLFQGIQTGGLTLPPGTPAIISAELLFPYTEGLNFVTALVRAGDASWDLVNEAYRNLPQSTEHILHPDKYLAGEMPLEVTLETAALDANWERLIDRTLGEFYLRQYLMQHLIRSEAAKAAAGWGGDRFHLYYNERSGQTAFALKIVWDTPDEAAEFAAVYRAFGDNRFPDSGFDGACWTSARETVCFVADTDSTLIVSAPDLTLARLLLGT